MRVGLPRELQRRIVQDCIGGKRLAIPAHRGIAYAVGYLNFGDVRHALQSIAQLRQGYFTGTSDLFRSFHLCFVCFTCPRMA